MMPPKGLWFPYLCLITLLVSVGVFIFSHEPATFPEGEGVELEVEPPLETPPVTIEQSLELDPE